jgi:hypothetical protein
MPYISKHILSFFICAFLSNLIFISYLQTTNYSGGEVGMVPFLTILNSIISFVISIVFILVLKIVKRSFSVPQGISIFTVFSILTLFFYFNVNPLKDYLGDVDFWTILSVIISSLIVSSVYFIYESTNNNNK